MPLDMANGMHMLLSCSSAAEAAVKYECPNAHIDPNHTEFP